jgi:flagellar hook-associated protein 2
MVYSAAMNTYMNKLSLLSSFYPSGSTAPPYLPANPMGMGMMSPPATNQFAKAQAGALIGLTSYASQLKSSSAALDASSPSSVWNQRSVTSSAPASVSGTAANGAKKASYTVNISQIAVAQQSAGTALSSTAVTTLAAGNQTFSMTSAGVAKNISFSVTAGDTNQTVLNKMSQSINAAKTGVTATVTTNATTGTSQLVLTANNTGTVNAFSLADVTGTAVANTGANTVLKAAADAAYSVNGISYTSSKNTVTLPDPKVSLTLSAPVVGATVTVGNNNDAITAAIKNFTNSYNNTLSYISQNQQYLSPQLANTLKQAFSDNAITLKKAGITANLDGTLKVDSVLLSKSIKTTPTGLMQSLGGYAGLAKTSNNLAQQIITSPLTNFAKLPSYNSLSSYNPALSSQRTAYWMMAGTLFNRLF